MKQTRDFNDFMSEHVNINDSRLDRLNSGVRGVSEHLGKNLDGFQKVERQGSYALRTIVKPVNDHEYDADILLYMDYVRGKSPKDYIADVYRCMRENQTYADKVQRFTGRRGVSSLTMPGTSTSTSFHVSPGGAVSSSATDRQISSNLRTARDIETGSTARIGSRAETSNV